MSDATHLSLSELRAQRSALQRQEDAVSFVRRLTQGRIDLVHDEERRRAANAPAPSGTLTERLANVFGQEHGGGSSRPPRETNISAEHPLFVELETLCQEISFGELRTLDDQSLENVVQQLSRFEVSQSIERKALFASIDALTTQLVKRYKDDGVNVDSLLAD